MIPNTKIFVGRLPPCNPRELRELFEEFGVVVECDIVNKCGFVHMENEEVATAAIQALHQKLFKGTLINVERGHMKERDIDRRGGGRKRGFNSNGSRGRGNFNPSGPIRNDRSINRNAPYNFDNRFNRSNNTMNNGSFRFDDRVGFNDYMGARNPMNGINKPEMRGFSLDSNNISNIMQMRLDNDLFQGRRPMMRGNFDQDFSPFGSNYGRNGQPPPRRDFFT